ncbi:hypothetical protein CVT26_009099 [Gymnopilus dilepis]|uniref:Gfo/Idh/MocA-like oxidoreductase N-terminal domain-containing protein n=1 Tax=Gymnopilus dilepis TaxID=231916 RepID=A0A409WCE1_9AGAR|nr:hypothetical protein CVT26_009099 [Gymnopilus dilepis]
MISEFNSPESAQLDDFASCLSPKPPMSSLNSLTLKSTVAIVGFGGQAKIKGLSALQHLEMQGLTVTAIVDPDPNLHVPSGLLNATVYTSVDELLKCAESVPNYAYVAAPHYVHTLTILPLLRAGVSVIKEKPFATSAKDAELLLQTAKETGSRLVVAAQRRFSDRYTTLAAWLPRIGRIHSVHAVERIVEQHPERGWRASRHHAGGGVVIDLGYHMIDQLVGLFGPHFEAVHSRLLKTKNGTYDVEDTAHILITFRGPVHVSLVLSRTGFEREELLEINGEHGAIRLTKNEVSVVNKCGSDSMEEHFTSNESSKDMLFKLFKAFFDEAPASASWLERDLNVMRLIEEIYSCGTGNASLSTGVLGQPKKWTWPRITPEIVEGVQQQLKKTLSIYDCSGVFNAFESEFKAYHSVPEFYALLHNSGTNALFALFYAAGITKGDEVIVPVYTFHATASPLMLLGATPVFIDTAPNSSNVNPNDIIRAITPSTKAVVVTHMWGMPCAMNEIVKICADNKILLLEDCSHAHGARIGDKLVGTFGDGAAWSIQGEKIVTGGEGGVTLTRHADMHYRQLIIGHYNKRCKQEIPADHPLRPFVLTGGGLKNRAHPLAVSIALNQLRLLPSVLHHKNIFALYIIDYLRDVPFLIPPAISQGALPSWYALVFQFDHERAPSNLTREKYVTALKAKGLQDIDIPGSTKPLNDEALYIQPWKVLPHLYNEAEYSSHCASAREFHNAKMFYSSAIKLPVWGFEDDWGTVRIYAETMKQVANDMA